MLTEVWIDKLECETSQLLPIWLYKFGDCDSYPSQSSSNKVLWWAIFMNRIWDLGCFSWLGSLKVHEFIFIVITILSYSIQFSLDE